MAVHSLILMFDMLEALECTPEQIEERLWPRGHALPHRPALRRTAGRRRHRLAARHPPPHHRQRPSHPPPRHRRPHRPHPLRRPAPTSGCTTAPASCTVIRAMSTGTEYVRSTPRTTLATSPTSSAPTPPTPTTPPRSKCCSCCRRSATSSRSPTTRWSASSASAPCTPCARGARRTATTPGTSRPAPRLDLVAQRPAARPLPHPRRRHHRPHDQESTPRKPPHTIAIERRS